MTAFAKPAIDLNYAAWSRTRGEFSITGTWFLHDDGTSEPCLFIMPTRGLPIGCKPAIVLMNNAYQYVNPREAAHTVRRLAIGMGMEGLTQAVKLADLINDHLSDLLSMPPDRRKREVVADATVRIGDGPARSIELSE